MTTEEKRAELEAANIKVRANASEERVHEMWTEWMTAKHDEAIEAAKDAPEIPDDAAIFDEEGEVVRHGVIYVDGVSVGMTGPSGHDDPSGEDAVSVEVLGGDSALTGEKLNGAVAMLEAGDEPAALTVGKMKLPSRSEANFLAFLEAHQDKMLGDKTPIVVEWARANLSAEEFKARYEGRTLA